ncbi:MAG: NAD(P)/FAD-dependent oxidoreductase [Muribaculaceae bacterium]|nr:NAD(P)/FAD-dependent oxidoreductase [Muribaculaceae bacterium]
MKFDALVIGAGPGGYTLAAGLAAEGLRTAIVEKSLPGGTCLNRGCIPTKTLCASGDAPWAEAMQHVRDITDTLRGDVRAALSGVEFIEGEAALLPERKVRVGENVYSAERIYIATGSAPASLPISGAELAIDSNEFLKLETLPQRVAIIGAGVIGLEFASILADKGVDVTVLEYCKEILPPADKDVAKRLRSILKRRGIAFLTGVTVNAIHPGFAVDYEDRKGISTLDTDLVIMAVGRRPVVPEGCAETDVELTPRGFIKVDPSTMATSAEGIYALGDCNGLCMLAHAAEAQARILLGKNVNMQAMPSVVFTHPACAWVGPTEESLEADGQAFISGKALYAGNGKALADGASEGFVKVLADPDSRRILAVHILGEDADALIGEATLAVALGADIDTLASYVIHPHPTLTELLATACGNCR